MKKRIKKLALSRETLRELDEKTVQPVAGGTLTGGTCSHSGCSKFCDDRCDTGNYYW